MVTCSDNQLLKEFIDALDRGFDIKGLGPRHYLLGLQVSSHNDGLHISQLKYAHDLLVKHAILLSKSVSAPMLAKAILTTATKRDTLANPTKFQEIVGSLQY